MRKREKPGTVKGILKELIEVCESCGGTRFQVTSYELFEPAGKKGFLAQLGDSLVPVDPQEYRREMRRRELADRNGVEVSYFCSDCKTEFVQFYPRSAWNLFVQTWHARYGD